MILMVVYMITGILIGILIKNEVDVRSRRKRIQNRVNYLQSTANQNNMEQYDAMLESIRSINRNLSAMDSQNKKEVR